MRSLHHAAHIYMIVGLVSGLAYREVTKWKHFTGETQLGLVHTHVLARTGRRPADRAGRPARSAPRSPGPGTSC